MSDTPNIDISEDFIDSLSPTVLKLLLQDHTKSTAKSYAPIFWATDNYRHRGADYTYSMPIKPELITKKKNKVIQPRVVKAKKIQTSRSKDMAEVFTPSWVCNQQNNLIDEEWFGYPNSFNTPSEDKQHWTSNPNKIKFPEGKTWQDYIAEERLEITCGEAPYLVSRYDTTTGEFIEIKDRIGILDRKLRVVSENTQTEKEWFDAARIAYQSCYGYEWQGDNLLLARENMLMSLMDYYSMQFDQAQIPQDILEEFATIISWNIWQMDGLKGVVPNSCTDEVKIEHDLFLGETITKNTCQGCAKNNIKKHNGTYCKIKDWKAIDSRTKKPGKTIKFIDTLK